MNEGLFFFFAFTHCECVSKDFERKSATYKVGSPLGCGLENLNTTFIKHTCVLQHACHFVLLWAATNDKDFCSVHA